MCGQPVRSHHRLLLRHGHVLEVGERRVEQADALALVAVHAGIDEARVLVPAELVNGVIHARIVEYAKRNQQLEVGHGKTGDLLEKPRLQLRDDILQCLLAVVGQVHEHRDSRSELDELLLNELALALVLLLLLGELALLLGGQVLLLALGLLHGLRLVHDRLDDV